ncbi:DUF3618 domain-containing protein [Actinomadura sp. DC4]|uniref:DUF3618 domain-containing protein n=1 Tax=Actinomadura sp. DC4 TaxID=3055069 RepID=UPI0025B1DEB2|nr:DUF3618 domain-containing protein [Actinomadura sp. DC4]MDN3359570.1 DUF3618 domain-containing protein [Actinomadura sp. DC4]
MTQSGSPSEERPATEPARPDREELAAGIEQTRQDLAETVEALAAKADVPTRVRGKATEVRERVGGSFTSLTNTAREKAPRVRERAGRAVPEPARRTTRRAASAVGERPAVLYAVAGAFAAAGLWVWRLRRRS